MKIVITPGGGGHFAPAQAVMESLPIDSKVLLIGRKYSMEGDKALSLEYQTALARNIPFVSITTGRLQRQLTRHTIPSLLKIPVGFLQSLKVLSEFKPDIVVSFGGYLTVPVVVAAKMLQIPVVIHEQTQKAGLANKLVAPLVDRICISFESSIAFFPKEKTILTGNPIRDELLHPKTLVDLGISEILKEKNPLLYITGGSIGSHEINTLIAGCVEKLLDHFVIIHQTGDAKRFKDFETLSKLRDSLADEKQKRYYLSKFISPTDVGHILKKAAITVSRGGINTLSEFLHFKIPALIIPLLSTQSGEQLINARKMETFGVAKVFLEEDATPEKLYDEIISLYEQRKSLELAFETAQKSLPANPTEKVIEVIMQTLKKSS